METGSDGVLRGAGRRISGVNPRPAEALRTPATAGDGDPAATSGAAARALHPVDRRWAVVALITAAAGLFASISLVGEKLAILADPNHTTSCDISAVLSCGTVIRTGQAEVFGFPNPLIGLVSYAVVIVLAVGVLAGARYRPWFWWGLVLGLVLGQIFLLWLWTEATFDINALCLYCMLVWFVHPILLLATISRCVRTGALPAGEAVRSTAPLWAAGAAALIILVVFGSVLIRFAGTMF